jgi:hypothetical protein
MKKNKLFLGVLALIVMGCPGPTDPEPGTVDTAVSAFNLTALVTAPVKNVAPVTTAIDTAQYTGSIEWQTSDGTAFSGATFAAATVYKALVTLSEKSGYTFMSVLADSFTYSGATVTNAANSGAVTITFPATAAEGEDTVVNALDLTALVTAPVKDAAPETTTIDTAQYTGTVAWQTSGGAAFTGSAFAADTVYEALVILTAKSGYTFTGVVANSFTYTGATGVSNVANSGTVTITFPATLSDLNVTLNVSADGSATQTTSQLTLTFSETITGLSTDDITLSGISGLNKGTLSGSGPSYILPISGFTNGGVLSVAVAKAGYAISGSPQSVNIYYAIESDGSEAGPFPLTEAIWTDGEITSTTPNSEVWYTFNVTSGTTYYVWMNADKIGSYSGGDGSKTLRALWNVSYAEGSSIFSSTLSAFTTPKQFTADQTGAVKIRMYPETSGTGTGTGTYALVYSTTDTRPDLNVTLNVSANGSAGYPTTRVTLASNVAIAGIAQSDFVISGVPGVTIVSWNGTTSAPISYWLDISGFTQGGELSITIQKPGYVVSQPQPVTIYYSSRLTRATTDPSFSPNAVAYFNGRFVYVGNASQSAWSTNGVTWNNVTISTTVASTFTAIAGGANHFVAVGPNGRMALSTNGASWSFISPSPFDTTQIYGVTYGGGRIVAVGAGGKAAYFTDSVAIGTPVLVGNTTFGTSNIYDVAYGDNKFVAVGADGKAAYSTDNGTTWNVVSDSKFGGSAISTVTWGNGKFVAAGAGGKIAWSSDGITWNAVTATTFSANIDDIAYGGGKFVAVSGSANTAYSTDGITWEAITDYVFDSYNGSTHFDCITYGGDRFVTDRAYWITP